MDYDLKNKIAKFAIALLLGLASTFAVAQGIVTGSISGIASDSSGALVSGARVSAKHLATNREYTTQSTGSGVISLRSLPPGNYDVRVEAPGFRAYESKGVSVNVGADTSLGAISLEVGSQDGNEYSLEFAYDEHAPTAQLARATLDSVRLRQPKPRACTGAGPR